MNADHQARRLALVEACSSEGDMREREGRRVWLELARDECSPMAELLWREAAPLEVDAASGTGICEAGRGGAARRVS